MTDDRSGAGACGRQPGPAQAAVARLGAMRTGDDLQAGQIQRLELAEACLRGAAKLTALANALLEEVEGETQLAASVNAWLSAIATRARRLHG